MSQYIDFNINNKILVKLKQGGYVHWMNHWNKVFVELYELTQNDLVKENIKPLEHFISKQKENGYVEFQAWYFMSIFGETIDAGKQPLFETTIKIEKTNPL